MVIRMQSPFMRKFLSPQVKQEQRALFIDPAPLARLEGQIALRLFFERVVAPRLAAEPPYRVSPLLRGPSRLRVTFDGIRGAAG